MTTQVASYPHSHSSFSPSLTATSSASSRPRTDIDHLPELDVPIDLEAVGMPDINEMFNFDEFESANDSHSPSTISPNRTPSPLPAAHSPLTFDANPNFDFLNDSNMDFSFDFLQEKPIEPTYPIAGPSSMMKYPQQPIQEIQIKQESSPTEPFPIHNLGTQNNNQRFAGPSMPMQPTPVSAQPVSAQDAQAPINFAGLPYDQQAALQQLMLNILTYQQKFGFDLTASGKGMDSNMTQSQPVSMAMPTTVDPSMVFSTSPGSGVTNNSYSQITPATTSGFGSTPSNFSPANQVAVTSSASSVPPSGALQPMAAGPASTSTQEVDRDLLEAEEDDELMSIGAHELPLSSDRHRSQSTFSIGDNLDSKLDRLAPLSSIFAAGKGKGGKKGGGMSSVVRGDDEDIDDDDSWRPSPEEYKKLSSKEKRQLRNKLSARAFRNRRKDYIGTLEGHIRERDGVIDDIRAELMNSRSENQDLRRELAALKASTMSILHPETAHQTTQSPAIFSALALPSTGPSSNPTTTKKSNPIPTPTFNPHKDLSGSSSIDSKLKWSNDNLFGGGSTICHTLLMPDTPLPTSVISSSPMKNAIPPFAMPRTNLNPMLSERNRDRSSETANLQTASANKDIAGQTFAEWSDSNAFSLRNMDSYRMQMWSRLAREAASDKAGLEGAMRPKFFVEPKSPSFASTSTSTATAHASASADASSSTSFTSAAQMAGLAATHITSRLAASFWSAFTTPSSSRLDTDKLTAVVTGRAKLRVVEEEKRSMPSAPAVKQPGSGSIEEDLMAALGGLSLRAGRGVEPGRVVGVRDDPLRAITGGLFKMAAGAS